MDRRTEYQYICRLHAGEFRDRKYKPKIDTKFDDRDDKKNLVRNLQGA